MHSREARGRGEPNRQVDAACTRATRVAQQRTDRLLTRCRNVHCSKPDGFVTVWVIPVERGGDPAAANASRSHSLINQHLFEVVDDPKARAAVLPFELLLVDGGEVLLLPSAFGLLTRDCRARAAAQQQSRSGDERGGRGRERALRNASSQSSHVQSIGRGSRLTSNHQPPARKLTEICANPPMPCGF